MEATLSNKRKVYLVFGKTQTCKSSFIKDVLGNKHDIKVGQGNAGESVTKSLKFYTSKNSNLMPGVELLIVDTIGLGDTHEEFTDDEILEKIEKFLLKHSNQDHLDGIIITESMKGDCITVINCLERVNRIFGCKCVGSVVVLGTKPNAVSPEDLQDRITKVERMINDSRVKGGLVLFKTNYQRLSLKPDEAQKQFQELHDRLIALDPLPLETIREKRNAIKERAEQIRKEETITKESTVNYQEVHLEQEIRQIPVTIPTVTRTKVPKRIAGVRVGKKFIPEVTETTQIIQHVVNVPKVENKTKTERLEIEPDPEYCYQKALAEFMEKQRSEFKRGRFNRE